jgi:UPF0716 protein FxsA
MRWLGVTALLLVVLAIAEVVMFILVAKAIGLLWAVLVALATSVVGTVLLRREGARGWRRFRAAVAEGRPPGREGADGAVGLLGALLLLTPGFLTDAAGLLLLAPPVRAAARSGVRRAAERRISPDIVGQVFGPRFVRARRGGTATSGPDSGPIEAEPTGPASGPLAAPTQTAARDDAPPPVIEGEIVDPPSS